MQRTLIGSKPGSTRFAAAGSDDPCFDGADSSRVHIEVILPLADERGWRVTPSPTISVLVPVRNQERFISRCLRSLLAQTLPRNQFEVVVIDDNSSDRTSHILELFREDITLLRNDGHLGLPASLNRGIRATCAPFVVRVDSDDYVAGDFLRLLHSFLSRNRHVDAVACDYFVVDDREEVLASKNCSADPIACAIMFRTRHLFDIGLYDERFLLLEERDLRIRFLRKYMIHRLELPLYRYRRHGTNGSNDSEAMAHYMSQLISKHGVGAQ
jgi:glycosyltransferase involved in cell wall biosynthesis